MKARRAQTPIMIRSDKAAAILARHVQPGRSQARLIEEALEEKFAEKDKNADVAARIAQIKAITSRVDKSLSLTMAEYDAIEYDDAGDPR
jgi:hypothetical protein